MNRRGLRAGFVVLFLAVTAATAATAARDWQAESAARDSFRHLPPNMRFYALRKAGLLPPPAHTASVDTGSGLRLVGKWGGGPSVKVTGRDSLVFLSRGSEVVAINFADTTSPPILSYIQAQGLVSRSVLVGNRLYVGSTGSDPKYVEVFDVTDPANAVKLGSVQTMLNDIAVKDTLVYTVSDDSFKVFNFANPASPTLVGACRDSGYTISVNAGYAYLGDRWGLYVIDATNPASPHRVASWGSDVISVTARNTICCVTLGNPNVPDQLDFFILDVANPASPQQLAHLANYGGYDTYLLDSLAFLSGYYTGGHEFRILSIADSAQPRSVGTAATPGEGYGVWADETARYAVVADFAAGCALVDVGDIAHPALLRETLAAHSSEDVYLDGHLAYIANYEAGIKILDVADPAMPVEIGSYDTAGIGPLTPTVAARDSFAYMKWGSARKFRVLDVTDPTRPAFASDDTGFNPAEDMVLRDTFIYVAEHARLQVYNVARPREPVLVGSCVLPGTPGKLEVSGSMAYVATQGVQCIDVADPSNPHIVGSYGSARVSGLSVVDTIVYGAGPYTGLIALSVANPAAPRLLDSLWLTDTLWWTDVVVTNTLAYVGGERVWVVDVSDPQNLRVVPGASWTPPGFIERLVYAHPHIYVACSDAGVCLLETLQVGVAEERPAEKRTGAWMRGSVVRDELVIELPAAGGSDVMLSAYDMSGRCVEACVLRGQGQEVRYSFARLPAGVYVLRFRCAGQTQSFKVVKL